MRVYKCLCSCLSSFRRLVARQNWMRGRDDARFPSKTVFEWISSREIKVYDFNMRARGLHNSELVVRWYDLRSGMSKDLRENPGRRRESTLYFSRSFFQPLAFQLYFLKKIEIIQFILVLHDGPLDLAGIHPCHIIFHVSCH